MSAVERAARAGYDASRDAAETEPWEDLPEWGRETFRAFTRAALAAAAPTVERVEALCRLLVDEGHMTAEGQRQVVALWGAP